VNNSIAAFIDQRWREINRPQVSAFQLENSHKPKIKLSQWSIYYYHFFLWFLVSFTIIAASSSWMHFLFSSFNIWSTNSVLLLDNNKNPPPPFCIKQLNGCKFYGHTLQLNKMAETLISKLTPDLKHTFKRPTLKAFPLDQFQRKAVWVPQPTKKAKI